MPRISAHSSARRLQFREGREPRHALLHISARTYIDACVLRSLRLRHPLCQQCRHRQAGMSLTWALMEGTSQCTCHPVPARCQQLTRRVPRSCLQSCLMTSFCKRKQVNYACSFKQDQSDKRVNGFAFYAAHPVCMMPVYFRGLCLGHIAHAEPSGEKSYKRQEFEATCTVKGRFL